MGGAGFLETSLHAFRIGHIHLGEHAAQLLGHGLAALFIEVKQSDLGAFGGQTAGGAFAQTRCAAGDDRCNAFEIHVSLPWV